MAKVKPTSGFETFEPGTYEVNRLEFFTKDDKGDPIFVEQETRGGMRLVARYRTYNDQDEGPPGSIGPDDIALLVYAFGGDPNSIPSAEDDPTRSKALAVAQEQVDNADKMVRVYVREGSDWIQSVEGMWLPVGTYTFKYAGVARFNEAGEPTWFNGTWGEQTIWQLEVDDPGSPFHGVRTDVWDSRTSWRMHRAITPDLALGTEEEELAQFNEIGLDANKRRRIVGEVKINETDKRPRPRLDKDSLRAVPIDEAPQTVPEEAEVMFIEHLYQAVADGVDNKYWRESTAWKKPGELSDPGKAWMKAHVDNEFMKASGIPKRFDTMTQDHVVAILRHIGRDDLARLIVPEEESGW